MPALSDYTNVFGTALCVLAAKGYRLWHDKKTLLYYAERNGWDFCSDSPVGLLGVVAIFEAKKPERYEDYWWRDEQVSFRDLPTTPPRYKSVVSRRPTGVSGGSRSSKKPSK